MDGTMDSISAALKVIQEQLHKVHEEWVGDKNKTKLIQNLMIQELHNQVKALGE